jgi:hypothetical protein
VPGPAERVGGASYGAANLAFECVKPAAEGGAQRSAVGDRDAGAAPESFGERRETALDRAI